jgi:hypothetical protein
MSHNDVIGMVYANLTRISERHYELMRALEQILRLTLQR